MHILAAVVGGALMGAVWAGIAGFLKATVGTHEVISTIMLNWIAIWVGVFLFGLGGPLQNDTQPFVPVSNDVLDESKLPIFWGDPFLQALHVGFFVALAALVVYWITLNRTTLGYEVRAVGFNPEAARYGGISVAPQLLPRDGDLGRLRRPRGRDRHHRLGVPDQHERRADLVRRSPSSGIAVALLGRNKAIGVGLSALLFAALVTGTSTRNLDPEIFKPELASNLTVMIQGLVVLFVGADVLILSVLGFTGGDARAGGGRGGGEVIDRLLSWRPPRSRRSPGSAILLGLLAFWVALPPLKVREPAVPVADRPRRRSGSGSPCSRAAACAASPGARSRSACSGSASATSPRARAWATSTRSSSGRR